MRIYCFTCKDHVLNTTEAFKLGGPYNGTMFEAAKPGMWRSTMFRQLEEVKDGGLFCPRCLGAFIQHNVLLTEHGTVQPGQESIDESFSIITDGDDPLPYHLAKIEPSKEIQIEFTGTSLSDKPANESADDVEDGEGLSATDIKAESGEEPAYVHCPKCNKPYINSTAGRRWRDKHVEGCND